MQLFLRRLFMITALQWGVVKLDLSVSPEMTPRTRRNLAPLGTWLSAAGLPVARLFCALAVTGLMLLSPAIAVAAGAPLTQNAPVIVGGDHNYPPYEFLDEDGNPTGYNVELTQAIAEVMGMKVEIRLGDWDTMRRALKGGTVDVLQGMVYSDARSKTFEFSPPHIIIHESVFARRGAPPITALEQLNGKELIVQKGGIMHDYLLENQVAAHLVLVDTHAGALRMLASGKHDYALVGNLPGLYVGRELGLSNIVPVGKPFAGQRYAYAVRKDNAELLAMFSEGLAILKNTGKHHRIYDKWLGPLDPSRNPWEKLVPVLGFVFAPLLIILGGIFVWNRSLKKEVARRTKELKLQQQQLIQADKMASLGVLVSGMAHEINNPNSLALLNMPIVLEAFEDSREILEAHYREYGDFPMGGLEYSVLRNELPHMLSEMLHGARRIKRIVDDLKDFARQGDPSLEEPVDINAVLQAAVRLVDNSIRKSTNCFKLHCAEGLPTIRGNAQRIEQVVINLILNACQAFDDPEKGIALATRYDHDKGLVICTCRDEGEGIAPEHLPRLTDPFFTTKREQGGTGLGLSVSATIVQQHGGTLAFNSSPGQGTTATLSLPVDRKDNVA